MPIVLAGEEWERIRRWTASDKRDPDAARRRDYLSDLEKASAEMTKDWPNSVENVNARNEATRVARALAAEQANEQFYREYVKRQQEKQRLLMEQARDAVFKNKDAPKLLLSAVIGCAIQKERSLQVEFQKKERHYNDELERKEAKRQTDEANRWLKERKERQRARYLENKRLQEEITKQAKEVAEQNRLEREEEIRLEQIDNIKAKQQMADIEAFEKKLKQEERARIKADMEIASREVAQRKREEDKREQLDEQLRHVYLQYKDRVDCRRAKTEKDLQAEKLRVLQKISDRLQTGSEARDKREQEILDKAVKEKMDIEDARREADRLRVQRQIQEKKELRAKFLRDEEQRLHEEETLNTWALLNRCKNQELTEAFEQRQREVNWNNVLKYREDLLRLWKEREDREARELAEQRFFYGAEAERKLRDADDKLLRHGEQLIREAAELGQPTYVLEKALDGYRNMYRLRAMPELPGSQQEHYPLYRTEDRTRPYGDPPPAPLLFDQEAVTVGARQWSRKDGLQERLPKQHLDRARCVPEPSFYRSLGRVNGLQEKSHKPAREGVKSTSLPPLPLEPVCTPVQLKSKDKCHCE